MNRRAWVLLMAGVICASPACGPVQPFIFHVIFAFPFLPSSLPVCTDESGGAAGAASAIASFARHFMEGARRAGYPADTFAARPTDEAQKVGSLLRLFPATFPGLWRPYSGHAWGFTQKKGPPFSFL